MELRKFKDKDLQQYLIVNESGSNSRGFWHDSTLFLGDNEIAHNRAHYINRTWECYRFQTSMFGVVRIAKEYWEKYYLAKFKNEHNYNKLTAARKEEFEKYLNEQKEIIIYNKMLKELQLYHC